MAKATLPTNYQDDVLKSTMGGKRRYTFTDNSDGTKCLEDATQYDKVGSNFGAADINKTNAAVNAAADASKIMENVDDIAANTQAGYMMGALAGKQLIQDLGALNSKGNAELLVNGTTTGIKTVPNLSQYRFLACYMVGNIGYIADLIIPVSLFKTLDNSVTSKRIRVIHGTEYYYDACYVTDTSINILAINNAPYYIYGIK